jgi:hypothetical protein
VWLQPYTWRPLIAALRGWRSLIEFSFDFWIDSGPCGDDRLIACPSSVDIEVVGGGETVRGAADARLRELGDCLRARDVEVIHVDLCAWAVLSADGERAPGVITSAAYAIPHFRCIVRETVVAVLTCSTQPTDCIQHRAPLPIQGLRFWTMRPGS